MIDTGFVEAIEKLCGQTQQPKLLSLTDTLAIVSANGVTKEHVLPPSRRAHKAENLETIFTFTGKYSTNETDTAIIAPTYPTTLPMRFAAGALTWNSVALCTSKVEIDAGNSVIMRECVNATDRSGYVSAIVTNRAPIITADPESVLVATQDRDAKWLTSSGEAFSCQIGATGNSIVFAAPEAMLENKQQGNRSDMLVDDLTWLCAANASTPDTELTITFD